MGQAFLYRRARRRFPTKFILSPSSFCLHHRAPLRFRNPRPSSISPRAGDSRQGSSYHPALSAFTIGHRFASAIPARPAYRRARRRFPTRLILSPSSFCLHHRAPLRFRNPRPSSISPRAPTIPDKAHLITQLFPPAPSGTASLPQSPPVRRWQAALQGLSHPWSNPLDFPECRARRHRWAPAVLF